MLLQVTVRHDMISQGPMQSTLEYLVRKALSPKLLLHLVVRLPWQVAAKDVELLLPDHLLFKPIEGCRDVPVMACTGGQVRRL